tara:strand:- start:156 stop:2159 length:2004 start_codon:yes stop_codon:yes gene_type:complete
MCVSGISNADLQLNKQVNTLQKTNIETQTLKTKNFDFIDQNPKIHINKFSFNSENDYIEILVKTSIIGYLDLNKFKIIYNEAESNQDLRFEGVFIKDKNHIFFKENLSIKLIKNFKQESKIKIFYQDAIKDEICNLNLKECKFRNLPKDIFIERNDEKWILTKDKDLLNNQKPDFKLIKKENFLEIQTLQKDQNLKYKIEEISINDQSINSPRINLEENINSVSINYSDNLSNTYIKDISDRVKEEKIRYEEFIKYEKKIKDLNNKFQVNLKEKEFLNKKIQEQKVAITETKQTKYKKQEKYEGTDESQVEKDHKESIKCSKELIIYKVNPNTNEKTEYVIIKNQKNNEINLTGCILKDEKDNQIEIPSEFKNLKEIKIESKNILNNDKDTIELLDKNTNQKISICKYQVNTKNKHKEITCTNESDKQITELKDEVKESEKKSIISNQKIDSPNTKSQKQITNGINNSHKIKITEINANPKGKDKNNEWLEIFNEGEDYNGIIKLKINSKYEEHYININKGEYKIIKPENTLTNTKLEILLEGENSNPIKLNNSLENQSYSLINNEFKQSEFISKSQKNPSEENMQCAIQEINYNTNIFKCDNINFISDKNQDIKINDTVKINYLKYDNQNFAKEIIKVKEKKVSFKNTGFTILSILSLVFMHKISI